MTLREFRNKIVIKDVEGNRTYLTVTINGCKYGQSYSNTVNTIEEMINAFIAFYFPLAVEDKLSINQLA
jgi:predicted nucleic-acid-binding Zn-ribbon protein